MGGMKMKTVMEKINKKVSRFVAFSKRHLGLYNKASKLCSLSRKKNAILATPVSSQSNVGFWWEQERLSQLEDLKELSDAIDSISSKLQEFKGLQSEAVENPREPEDSKIDHDQNQALKFQSCSASNCIQDDSTAKFEAFIKIMVELDQIVANSDIYIDDNNFDGCNEDGSLVIHKDLEWDNLRLDGYNQEDDDLDDEYFDFLMNCEELSMNLEGLLDTWFDSLAVEDGGAMVMHKDFDEDNLQFSDFSSM